MNFDIGPNLANMLGTLFVVLGTVACFYFYQRR